MLQPWGLSNQPAVLRANMAASCGSTRPTADGHDILVLPGNSSLHVSAEMSLKVKFKTVQGKQFELEFGEDTKVIHECTRGFSVHAGATSPRR